MLLNSIFAKAKLVPGRQSQDIDQEAQYQIVSFGW